MPAPKKAKAAHKKRLEEEEAAKLAEIAAREAQIRKQRPTPETYNTRITNRKPQPKKSSEVFQRIKYLEIIVGFISPAESSALKHIIKLSHVSSYFREAIVFFSSTFWINAVKVCTDFFPSSLPFPHKELLVDGSTGMRPHLAIRFRQG